MIKEELRSGALPCSLDDGDENSREFVALGTKRLQFGRWHDLSIDEEFQPIRGFFQLPQRVAAFRDELGFASSAMSFPIIRPDRSSRAEQLFAQHLSFRRFWQASEQADDSQRKLFGAVLEVVFFLHKSDHPLPSAFSLLPWPRSGGASHLRRRRRKCEVGMKKDGVEARVSSFLLVPSSFPRRGVPRRCRRCT